MVSILQVNDIKNPRDSIGLRVDNSFGNDKLYDVAVGFVIDGEERFMSQGRGDGHYVRNMVVPFWGRQGEIVFVEELR